MAEMSPRTECSHTPGPWRFHGAVTSVTSGADTLQLWCGNILPSPASGYRGDVAYIQSADQIDGITRQEAEANARLIAAAPDLLEALKPFADLGVGSGPGYETETYRIMRDAIRNARAAVDAAKGAA